MLRGGCDVTPVWWEMLIHSQETHSATPCLLPQHRKLKEGNSDQPEPILPPCFLLPTLQSPSSTYSMLGTGAGG